MEKSETTKASLKCLSEGVSSKMSSREDISQATEEHNSEKSYIQTTSREGGILNKQINGTCNLSIYNTPILKNMYKQKVEFMKLKQLL